MCGITRKVSLNRSALLTITGIFFFAWMLASLSLGDANAQYGIYSPYFFEMSTGFLVLYIIVIIWRGKMDKIVKTRKDRICDACLTMIKKGELCNYYSGRNPRYDDDDKQIGIEYYHGWLHIDSNACGDILEKTLEGK